MHFFSTAFKEKTLNFQRKIWILYHKKAAVHTPPASVRAAQKSTPRRLPPGAQGTALHHPRQYGALRSPGGRRVAAPTSSTAARCTLAPRSCHPDQAKRVEGSSHQSDRKP